MVDWVQAAQKNGLLKHMPADAFDAIRPHLQPADLPIAAVLVEASQPIEHVHFILSGIAAQVCPTSGRLEIGVCGHEGMTAATAVLGIAQTPHDTFVQISGSALRVEVAQLQSAMQRCTPLRGTLLRYIQVLMVQMSETARSAMKFKIEARAARWILMCHDRIEGDDLPFTHDFLSDMLGVRRAGVTDAIHMLEGQGAIVAKRGIIAIRNRPCLEQIAADSYGTPEAEYRRLIVAPSGAATPQ